MENNKGKEDDVKEEKEVEEWKDEKNKNENKMEMEPYKMWLSAIKKKSFI